MLRQPLENILIRNITRLFADGRIEPVEFDAAAAFLSSNGAVVCLTKNAPSPQARMLRQLQGTTSTTSVDYAVLNPSNDLLSLDPTTFASVVSNSQELNNLASAVGSSGVTAVVPSELSASTAQSINAPAGASPAAVSAAQQPGGSSTGGVIGGVVGGFLAAVGVGVAVMAIRNKHRKPRVISSMRRGSVRAVIVSPNPVLDIPGATATYRSQQVVGFGPQKVRTSGTQV